MIPAEEIRALVFHVLAARGFNQYVELHLLVAGAAREMGYTVRAGSAPQLDEADQRRLREIVWGLIIEGVLAIGFDGSNDAWPFLSVTEYGERVLAAGRPLPHDPDGYLRDLSEDGPLDEVEARYIPQALEAFRRNLPDASAVMLGAASEHLIWKLAEAIVAADPEGTKKLADAMRFGALGVLRELQIHLEAHKGNLSRRAQEQLSTNFLATASMVRLARNDAGHPALGAPVSRDEAFVNLRIFAVHRKWVLDVVRSIEASGA